jgi:iron complex transport system ATP-binding protein
VLSQNIEVAFPLRVAEVVMMGRYPHFGGKPMAFDHDTCEEAMRFVDVLDLAERDYRTLSGGERQRVHFARVMAQVWHPAAGRCRYLILDEPLTFLDVHYQFEFMHKLRELLRAPDLIVIGVVHDLNLAATFADQIVLLHKGRVLASGSRDAVLTPEHIREAYQLEPVIIEDRAKGRYHLFFE